MVLPSAPRPATPPAAPIPSPQIPPPARPRSDLTIRPKLQPPSCSLSTAAAAPAAATAPSGLCPAAAPATRSAAPHRYLACFLPARVVASLCQSLPTCAASTARPLQDPAAAATRCIPGRAGCPPAALLFPAARLRNS